MSNAEQSIFPTQEFGQSGRPISDLSGGMTKREYMATHIAVGLCACPNYSHDVALGAVAIADRLLEALAGQSN